MAAQGSGRSARTSRYSCIRARRRYALARTERKTAAGYHGFQFHYAPDVTLDEDLARRDLTINAMAREVAGGRARRPVIDPFDGRPTCARACSGM